MGILYLTVPQTPDDRRAVPSFWSESTPRDLVYTRTSARTNLYFLAFTSIDYRLNGRNNMAEEEGGVDLPGVHGILMIVGWLILSDLAQTIAWWTSCQVRFSSTPTE